jgi:hypothetical protein
MEKFVPFHEFQQELRKARQDENRSRSPSPLQAERVTQAELTPERLQEIQNYLAEQHRKMEVIHSFVGDDGQYIDCIKTGSQPGLQGKGAVATPPPGATDTGSAPGPIAGDRSENAAPRLDRFGNVMQCPAGCVPVRRVTVDQIARAGSLENYFKKAPGGGALPPSPGVV